MRLAQSKVQVAVIGSEGIGSFSAEEPSAKPEQHHLSAYIVLHEQDAAELVRSAKALGALLADPEVAGLAASKGLLAAQEPGHTPTPQPFSVPAGVTRPLSADPAP